MRAAWGSAGRRRGSRHRIVVVGGGRAGVAAVEELRRQGYAGDVAVLYDEETMPYDRPACAKGVLTGHLRPRDARLRVQAGDGVEWWLGRRAVELDADAHVVYADTGEQFPYDALVIATGAAAAVPPGWPVHEPGLHTLYRLSDAWRLRTELRDAERVAVVGAGLTGCEVAHAVRSMSRKCLLVDSKPHALVRPLGEHVGRMVTREIARDHVDLRLGRRVVMLARARRGWVLGFDDGEEVHADAVVATTGERPDTGWLEGTPGLDLSDGVLCDETLRVVGVQDVVAAGVAARWPNLRYSARPGRIGQWIAALEQGRGAARTLLAGDRPAAPVTHVPRFWSDQFGLRIQVCGVLPTGADGDAEVSVSEQRPGRSDVARAGVVVGYHVDGELVGLIAVNASKPFTSITRTLLADASPRVAAPPVAPPRPVAVASAAGDPGTRGAGLRAASSPFPAPAGPPPISGPLPLRKLSPAIGRAASMG